MWMDLDFADQVIEVKRAYVWAQFKVPKSKASKAPVPMHPVLAGFLMAWRERTPYAKDEDYVFPSFRLKGKKPLSASIMVQKYLRPAAIKAGVIKEDERVRFGFHNFRHSLASSLVKLKCDPKTVQGILRHEDVRTTMQLYAQSTRNRDSKHRASSWHSCSETRLTYSRRSFSDLSWAEPWAEASSEKRPSPLE